MMINLSRPVQPRLRRNLALTTASITLATAPAMADRPASALDTAAKMGATLWRAEGEGGEAEEFGSVASGDETVDFLAVLLQIEGI